MQIHQIHPQYNTHRRKKRIGRGGKRGTYSGRGTKGQKARAGARIRPEMRDIIKKIPKKRGYRFTPHRETSCVINIGALERLYANGESVSLETLRAKGIVPKYMRVPHVKILGKGKLTKKLSIFGCAISKSAKEAIEKAGGTVNEPLVGTPRAV